MALNLFNWISFDRKELEALSKEQLLFIILHELGHARQLPSWDRQADERAAQRYAIEQMQKKGYTFHELLIMEIDYRIYQKYGLTLKQYIEVMQP